MKEKEKAQVGIIIGRFQTPYLHKGHIELISTVSNSHDQLIIFVGLSPNKSTYRNPLSYRARFSMLSASFPEATILYIKDVQDDSVWSENLDNQINDILSPEQSCCLYGSRDSFIPYYDGKFKVKELIQETYYSSTEVRKQTAALVDDSESFRKGVVWSTQFSFPSPQFCVDIAIFSDDFCRILLGRKKKEDKYRLIGGFVENEESLEEAATRETKEETHLTITSPKYVGSFPIDDFRYRGERDKITTALFRTTIEDGVPCPDDDIHELKWFDFTNELLEKVVPNHVVLVDVLLKTENI